MAKQAGKPKMWPKCEPQKTRILELVTEPTFSSISNTHWPSLVFVNSSPGLRAHGRSRMVYSILRHACKNKAQNLQGKPPTRSFFPKKKRGFCERQNTHLFPEDLWIFRARNRARIPSGSSKDPQSAPAKNVKNRNRKQGYNPFSEVQGVAVFLLQPVSLAFVPTEIPAPYHILRPKGAGAGF
jgi:hypothetical protein